MDIETRYRRGTFIPKYENPQWISNRLISIDQKVQEIDALITKYKNAIKQFEMQEKEVSHAMALLGVSSVSTDLLAITERLISLNPKMESSLWQAMWDVKKFKVRKNEFEKVLREYSNHLEHRQHHVDFGWPTQWPDPYCDFWLEIGGNAETATAWANKGWWPASVLTEKIYLEAKYSTIEQRVKCTTPPPMLKIVQDATDFPSEYESDVVA